MVLLSKEVNSATVRVVNAIASRIIVPLYNNEILAEYHDVLNRPKFPFSNANIDALVAIIRQYGIEVERSATGEIFTDMDNLVFYEVAMSKRNDDAYLISGNIKHFPQKKFIVTPSELMKILESGLSELHNPGRLGE